MSCYADKLRCPHCLEELDYLENPKVLPCSHIFCSPCLESSLSTKKGTDIEVTCSICSKKHLVPDVDSMPPANFSTSYSNETIESEETINVKKEEIVTEKTRCGRCKELVKAVCFCKECKKKLCPQHEKLHEEYFCEESHPHKLMSMEAYLKSPAQHVQPQCEEHGKDYVICCKHCYCLRCGKCSATGKCGAENGEHSYHTLGDASEQLKKEFDGILKKCSEKVKEMCRLEKETWKTLDNFEVQCEYCIKEVDLTEEKAIEAIREKSTKMREEILKLQVEKSKEVESMLEAMRENREELDQVRAASQDFIGNHNIIEVVQRREEKLKELTNYLTRPLRLWNPIVLSLKGTEPQSYDLELVTHTLPEKMEFISSHNAGTICYCAQFLADGKVLIGTGDGLRLYSKDCNRLIRQIPKDNMTSTDIEYSCNNSADGSLYFANFHIDKTVAVGTWNVKNGNVTEGSSKNIFTVDDDGTSAAYLSVSRSYIAVVAMSVLTIFDRHKQSKSSGCSLPFNPDVVRFYGDDHLLISGENELSKFIITEKDNTVSLEQVWRCGTVSRPSGICVLTGKPYIAVMDKTGCLSFISHQGVLLRTISSKELVPSGTDAFGQIDIHGDMLVVPCWDQKNFMTFKLC